MKVKVTLTSDDGQEWVAESKDIGLVATGASMLSALEAMQDEIRNFFHDAFGSEKMIQVVCSKIKATAAVTVVPLDERPEKPLYCYEQQEDLDESSLIETPEQLALPSGAPDDDVIDASFTVEDGEQS